jgi:hypothetical protein
VLLLPLFEEDCSRSRVCRRFSSLRIASGVCGVLDREDEGDLDLVVLVVFGGDDVVVFVFGGGSHVWVRGVEVILIGVVVFRACLCGLFFRVAGSLVIFIGFGDVKSCVGGWLVPGGGIAVVIKMGMFGGIIVTSGKRSSAAGCREISSVGSGLSVICSAAG